MNDMMGAELKLAEEKARSHPDFNAPSLEALKINQHGQYMAQVAIDQAARRVTGEPDPFVVEANRRAQERISRHEKPRIFNLAVTQNWKETHIKSNQEIAYRGRKDFTPIEAYGTLTPLPNEIGSLWRDHNPDIDPSSDDRRVIVERIIIK